MAIGAMGKFLGSGRFSLILARTHQTEVEKMFHENYLNQQNSEIEPDFEIRFRSPSGGCKINPGTGTSALPSIPRSSDRLSELRQRHLAASRRTRNLLKNYIERNF